MTRLKKIICISLIIVLSLSACNNKDKSDIKEIAGTKDASEVKDYLSLAMCTPKSLNPILNKDKTVDSILKLIYQPLINFDNQNKPIPSVAKDWTLSEDGLTLSLNLRDDIFFTNGDKLRARDVVFTIKEIKNSKEGSFYKKVGEYIESSLATGEYSLNIKFMKSYSKNMEVLDFPVIPSSYYSSSDDKGMMPIGSGAYYVKELLSSSKMFLKANPNYVYGEANIKDVTVTFMSSEEPFFYAFKQGKIDVLNTDISNVGKVGVSADIYPMDSYEYDFIGFNFRNNLFKEKQIRQAIAYCVNKENLYETTYLKFARVTNTPINPTEWLYEENVMSFSYDLNMSKTMLKNLGFDGVNIFYDNSRVINILVNSENKERVQVARKLKDTLNSLGFLASLSEKSFDDYSNDFKNGKFDIVVGGWVLSPVTDLNMFFATGGEYNYIGYSNTDIDKLIFEANTACGTNKMILAYSTLQKKLAEELPYISLVFRKRVLFVNKRIDIIEVYNRNIYQNINEWKITT